MGPRTLKELFDAGVKIFGRHALPLMLTSALGSLPGLVAVLSSDSALVRFFAGLLGALIGLVVHMGVIRLAYQTALGRDVKLADCIELTGGRLFVAIVVSVIVAIAAMCPYVLALLSVLGDAVGSVAVVLSVVLSFAVLVAFSFVLQVVVIEGENLVALERSLALIRGHFWRAVAVILVFSVLSMLAALVIGAAQVVAGGGASGGGFDSILEHLGVLTVSGAVLGLITGAVLLPLQTLVITLLYLDVRVRKEGVDIEQLAAETRRA